MKTFFKRQNWMLKGILLGLAFFAAVFFVQPVGVSTQFSVVSGVIYSAIDQDVITVDESRESGYQSTNAYYDKDEGKLAKNIKHPWTYELIFVLAIPLGAVIGYLLFGRRNQIRVVPEKDYRTRKVPFMKQYLMPFVIGFLLLFGARMAGGCTSGHMMSGMMQGSVSGYLFAASVFITAIPTALITGLVRPKGEVR